jgi:hypothetical protein
MKKLIIGSFFATLILAGCEKNKLAQKIEVDPTGNAWLKVGYFMPFSASTNKSVHVTVDGQRIGSVITYAIANPGGGYNMGGSVNPDYYAIAPGTRAVNVAIPKAGSNLDSIVVFSGSINVAADQRQTVMLTDTGTIAKATVISDIITDPAAGNSRAKFFNGIPNAGAIDLYVTPSAGVSTLLTSGIAYKGASGYFEFPGGVGTLTFAIVKTGMPNITANQLSTYAFTASQAGRVYTILSRGYDGLGTADARRSQVSLIVNR